MSRTATSGVLSFTEPRGSDQLYFDEPDGNEWSLGGFFSDLYAPPNGEGDGGGNQVNDMTTEYTDVESYVTHFYPLTCQLPEARDQVHKHMLVFCLADTPEVNQDSQTFAMVTIYWINMHLRRSYRAAKTQLRNYVYEVLTKQYPQALPELTNLIKKLGSGRFNVTDDDSGNRETSEDGDGRSTHSDEDSYEGGSRGGLVEAWSKPISTQADESFWSHMGPSASDQVMETVDRLISRFLREHMGDEDFAYRENNAESYTATETKLPLTLENRRDGHRFDVRPWELGVDRYSVKLGSKLDELRYENKLDKPLDKSRTAVSGSAYVNENNVRDDLEIALTPASTLRAIEEVKTILSQTAAAKGGPGRRALGFGGDANNGEDPTGSWTSLLTAAASARKQTNDAVQKIKDYIRNNVGRPAGSIIPGTADYYGTERESNFLPFLFRGGFKEYFKFIGVCDVLPNDNAEWHTNGEPSLKDQIMKVVTHRENGNVYNVWGENLSVGSMLYLVEIRAKSDGSLPRMGCMPDRWEKFRKYWNYDGETEDREYQQSSSAWYLGEDENSRKDAGFGNMDNITLDSKLYSGRPAEEQGWCGWDDYDNFEVLPMTWGNRPPTIEDLKYIDIFGNVAIAKPEFIGTIKYDYIADATSRPYPWASWLLSLGRQGENGMEPTHEACKLAMMNLPRIPVLIGHKM